MPFDLRMPDGTIIRGVPDNISQEELKALGQRYAAMSAPTPAPTMAPAPVTPTPAPDTVEEEGILSTLGRAAARGVPILRQGVAQVIEDAPEVAASLFSMTSPVGPVGQAIRDLGKVAAKSETYRGLTGDIVAGERAAAEEQLADIGPRRFAGFFEEEGVGRRIGSLAETVAESVLPVGAGVATGLITRSPVAAGAVMTGGTAPMTYGGIRERQQGEGIDDVNRAVFGTVASSALDVLTGIGGKVLTGTAALAARELLEGGLRNAATRIAKSGGEEAGTEALQNVIEQVAGGTDPTTKQAMLETLEAGLAGALGGTVFTGATEAVSAPFRPRPGAVSEAEVGVDPAVRAEFQRLAAQEVAAVVAANPGMDQNAATELVAERAEELLATATANVTGIEGEADVTPGPDTGMDVTGRGGASVTPAVEPAPPAARTSESGAIDEGRLGEPVPSVPVADVGTREGVGTLTPITAAQVKTTVPAIEQAFADNQIDFEDAYGVKKLNAEQKKQAARIILESPEVDPYDAIDSVLERGQRLRGGPTTPTEAPVAAAPEIDPTLAPIYEAPTLVARRKAARSIIEGIIDQTVGDVVVPAKVTNQIADQMARRASRKEVFDPVELTQSALAEQGIIAAPEVPAPEVAAPEVAAPEVAAPEPEVFIDNPGGDWLVRKQRQAEEQQAEALEGGKTIGTAARMLSGPATQTIRRVEVPVEKLRTLEGVRGEQPEPGQPKYDALRKSVDEKGFDREKAGLPMVFVNHNGEAFLYEGNNRVAVAAEEGVESLPVEVQYINGAEAVPGPFAPEQVLAEHRALTSSQAVPDQVFEDIPATPATTNLISEPSSNDIFAAAEELPPAERVNVRARLDRIMAQYEKSGDVDRLLGSLEALREDVDRRIDRDRAKQGRDRVRGFERAMEVVYRAERTGQLTPEAAGLVRWLLEQNPAIADDLALSLRTGGADSPAGQYNPALRIATIFTGRANDGTAVHEVLHHTERLMPDNIRDGIRAEWAKRVNDLIALADRTDNANMREVLGAIVQAYYGDAQAQKLLRDSFEAGTIPYSVYHLSNPSEFWAVNATDLVGKQADQTSWLSAARTWLRGLIEKAKSFFGLPSDAAVIAGLDAVLTTESGAIRGEMLATTATTFADTGTSGGTTPPTNANVDQVLSAKLTKAQIKRLEEAAGIRRMKLSAMQNRIARSRNAQETMSLAGRLMLMARGRDDSINILTSLFNSIPPNIFQTLLAPLETGDVVRLGKRAGLANAARIDNMMRNQYIPYVNRIMERASTLAKKWVDFTSRSPESAKAMADVMFFSNMIDADPTLAPSAAEYMKRDQKLTDLTARLAAEKDPKKQRTLKGEISKRRGEIQRLYFGGQAPDGTIIAGWNDVSPEGKEIFRAARDHYRADFNEHYRLLMQRIDDADFDEEDAARLKLSVENMFADAKKRMVYFPMKRFGDYWVTVGKGASGEFHMFETASEQDAFLSQLRRDGETRAISSGFGRSSLRNMVGDRDASVALKNILDAIDGGNVSDVDTLKDHIFQMYLTALPEADMRRRFIHRQFKTGFSTDVLRSFASTAIASANQLGRLAYGYKFKNLTDMAYAETEGNPSKRRLDTITRELEMRIDTTLLAKPDSGWGKAANLGAKATFLFLLSSPKSAIMNLTQLHIVGLPALSAEFGEAATLGMTARYTSQLLTGKRIANPFRDEEGNVRLQVPNFTAQNSPYIEGLRESDPNRYAAILKAWDYAREREVTESTFSSAANVYERSNEPSTELGFRQAVQQGDTATAIRRATSNMVDAMGALFHHTERMGREVMYMSAFELAYDRNLKRGMTPEKAGDAAMETAANLTNQAMFDFSNWNKSRAAKTPVGKLALQMRSYSLAMTSLMFRSAANMVGFHRTKAERLAAARVFFGVGAMTTLYGGFRASQFYMLAMLGYGLFEFVKSMADVDDEDEEVAGGYLTPETIQQELLRYADGEGRELSKKDMDFYIRSAWIPETFGPGGTMQEALGLDDGAAKKLEAAADIGLPGIFGVDISNSVALTNLWHPVDTKSDDAEVEIYETLGRIGLGPSGALFVGAPVKFVTEANKGNLDRAVESIMPMAIRGFVKAQRLADEGLVVGKNRDIVLKDPSFYDTYSLAMQSLGFAEAETSRAMQMDIAAGEIEREVSEKRTDLLDRRYRAALDFYADPNEETQRALGRIERDINIYNLNFPSNAITEDAKQKSFDQKSQEAMERAGGVGFNPKIPVRQPLAERRAAELGE